MLEGLVRDQWAPEGVAVLGVLDGELEDPFGGAGHLCALQHGGVLQLALDIVLGGAGLAEQRIGRHVDLIEAQAGEATHQIGGCGPGRTVTPGVPDGITNWATPSPSRALTKQRSAWPPASTGPLVPASTYPSPPGSATTSPSAGSRRRPVPGKGTPDTRRPPSHRPPARPGCLCWAGVPRRDSAAATTLVGITGPGRDQPAHLLDGQGQVGEGASRDAPAAVLLGHQHRDPSELRPASPPATIEAVGLLVGQATDLGQGTGVLEELSGRLAEQLLIVGEAEVHAQRLFPAAPIAAGCPAGHDGAPRTSGNVSIWRRPIW